MLKYAYNKANRASNPRKNSIASATAIQYGEVVKKTNGLVVAVGDTDQDDPYLGVSAEDHDGATTGGRQVGTEILIYDDPNDCFEYEPKELCTATGGSTTTFVDSNLQFAVDDQLNGGYLKIVSCAADSSLNGRKVKISDYTASGGTVTLAETLPVALAAGDTAYICPGPIAVGTYNWDLDSDGTGINWEDTSAGEAIRIDKVDPLNFKIYIQFRLHLNGNHPIAV